MIKITKNPYSVNCCQKCKKNLTIIADQLGYKICADCNYQNTRYYFRKYE